MKYTSSLDVDANSRVVEGILFPFKEKKVVTFDGGTLNGIGDINGTQNPLTLYNVTGDVAVFLLGVCKTTLVGAATLEVGVTDNTASILAQIANATLLVDNEGYTDATPTLAEAFTPQGHIVSDLDIIMTAGSADITAGVINFYCFWRPLSDDGDVAAA